ncbi:MAG: NBR1-Ig-like domain-containing protein, partial [Anaerolineae bacterium]
DPSAGAYRYEYADESGAQHAVTLRTAAALASDVATSLPRYVRGVMIRGAAGDAAPSVVDVLRMYRQQSAAEVAPELTITWQVKLGNQAVATIDKPLTESWFGWQVPAQPGTYSVSASIAGLDRGAVEVAVGARLPEEEIRAVTAGVGSGGGTPGSDATPGGALADACYNAAYVADVSVPDGTRFDNNKEFTKTWKVRNNGTCAWDAGTEIAFVSGSQLGAPGTLKVGALEVGQEIEISVPMKTSDQDGAFTGNWQIRNKDGFYGQTLTVVIKAGEEVAAAPPASSPPVVGPIGNIGSFEAGGHIDSFGRPDLMKYAGLKWIKIQTYAGADVSGAIANAHAQGFKILLGVLGDKELVMDPGYQQEYAASVAAMAAAGADGIEVWNEPNINREWPTGQVSGANYTALLAKAYPAIKAANPGTLVVSGAPAPTGFWGAAGCSPDGCNDDAFVGQMAAAGAARYMDCIGAHHNAGATAPSASSGHPAGSHYSWYFFPTLNLYYNAFGGARKVCFTELGYLTDDGMPSTLDASAPAFAWARNVTLAQQAAWLAEAAALSANSRKVRLMIIWNVDFTRYDSDPMAGYAIIRPDGSCPACDALRGVLGGR